MHSFCRESGLTNRSNVEHIIFDILFDSGKYYLYYK